MKAATCTVLLVVLATAAPADEALNAAFGTDVLVIVANDHACYRFDVYLAASDEQQRRGLMFVRELPDTTGMLFVYDEPGYRSMWMKNTYIPLDIAFATAAGRIVNVVRSTKPLSLASITSTEPATYVLELNAGVTARLAIGPGSRILWGPIHATEPE